MKNALPITDGLVQARTWLVRTVVNPPPSPNHWNVIGKFGGQRRWTMKQKI
jgi:hypothetical protein